MMECAEHLENTEIKHCWQFGVLLLVQFPFFFEFCSWVSDWRSLGFGSLSREVLSSLPFVILLVNAGDLYVSAEAGSPGALPGGRKKSRNWPASPQPFLSGPVSGHRHTLYSPSFPPSLRASRAETVTWEGVCKFRVWVQCFLLHHWSAFCPE